MTELFLLFVNTVESQFLKPPRETKCGWGNRYPVKRHASDGPFRLGVLNELPQYCKVGFLQCFFLLELINNIIDQVKTKEFITL